MSEIKRASIAIMHKYTTAEDWAQKNPILGAGELGIESNTKKFKFGDGVTPWNSLSYATRLNIENLQDGEDSGTLQQFSNTTNFTIPSSITDSDSITYNIDFITEGREDTDKIGANGSFAISLGKTSASGIAAFTSGEGNIVSGNYSFANGYHNIVRGTSSQAFGFGTSVGLEAIAATAFGIGTQATKSAQFVLGKYNETNSDALLIIGNGSNNTNRSNALYIDKSGNIYSEQITEIKEDIESIKEEIGDFDFSASIDQEFNPLSENAQSGIAVNQALGTLNLNFVLGLGENSMQKKNADAIAEASIAFGNNSIAGIRLSKIYSRNNTTVFGRKFIVKSDAFKVNDILSVIDNDAFYYSNIYRVMEVAPDSEGYLITVDTTSTKSYSTETDFSKGNKNTGRPVYLSASYKLGENINCKVRSQHTSPNSYYDVDLINYEITKQYDDEYYLIEYTANQKVHSLIIRIKITADSSGKQIIQIPKSVTLTNGQELTIYPLVLSSDRASSGEETEDGYIEKGLGAISFGVESLSVGTGSLTLGTKTEASGNYSLALGYYTEASMNGAFASGYFTTASGNYSTTFGVFTQATEQGAIAVGRETIASAVYAYAEGWGTKATAQNAHAEGYYTEAKGKNSHSEGSGTYAYSPFCHAEGRGSKAGDSTNTVDDVGSGVCAHAEGYGTKATHKYSHAEGFKTQALQEGAHAEGKETVAAGYYSHAGGEYSEAHGSGSFAFGYDSEAHASYSFAGGYKGYTTDNAYGSFSFGNDTRTYHKFASAFGNKTSTGRDYQMVVGTENINDPNAVFIVGNGGFNQEQNATSWRNAFEVLYDGDIIIYNKNTKKYYNLISILNKLGGFSKSDIEYEPDYATT